MVQVDQNVYNLEMPKSRIHQQQEAEILNLAGFCKSTRKEADLRQSDMSKLTNLSMSTYQGFEQEEGNSKVSPAHIQAFVKLLIIRAKSRSINLKGLFDDLISQEDIDKLLQQIKDLQSQLKR